MPESSKYFIYSYPYDSDILEISARHIINDNLENLPDLTRSVILLPNYQVASDLRRHILEQAKANGHSTVVGPRVFLFRDYILKNTLVNYSQLSNISAELMIINSLNENKELFGHNNTLTSAYALQDLINELTQYQVVLPSSLEAFKQQLAFAYQTHTKEFEALSQEARLVFTIWQAWHQQLQDMQQTDKETLYQLKLGQNHKQSTNQNFYLIGTQNFLPSELNWIKTKINSANIKCILQGEFQSQGIHPDALADKLKRIFNVAINANPPQSAKGQLILLIYNNSEGPLKQRVTLAQKSFPQSPLKNHISLYRGSSFEDEAQAIQIQLRLWLQQGKSNIALILEDRRLARRVRALLERYGVGLYDSEGWALSTSSAASIVESLLESIEENFNHIALLNLLKSHFVFEQNSETLRATNRLEQDIIPHEKIHSDLARYKNIIASRQQRLGINEDESSKQLIDMLNSLENATTDLRDIFKSGNSTVSKFVRALLKSLNHLQIKNRFNNDDAGQTIIALLENILSATELCDTQLQWVELRQWLGNKFEETTFTVNNQFKTQIKLLHLHQSNLTRHDAIIIGSATKDYLPGSVRKSPFFNEQVHQELKLSHSHEQLQERFFYFRRLLDSADTVCLSYHSGEQEAQVSPWLELLQNFHQLAYNDDLSDELLKKLVHHNQIPAVAQNNSSTQVAANITQQYLPQKISASAHQSLINCPYTFFVAEVLKLRAPEEIRLTLAKNDYGERIHYILFLFHQGKKGTSPTPFKEKVTPENRSQAIKRLEEISISVFQFDLEDNFQHRGWYKRWAAMIPKYIDWLIEEQQHQWSFQEGETSVSRSDNNLTFYGRIDRIDHSPGKNRVIDYKTGSFPNKEKTETGEAVQLTHYAMACEDSINEFAYLSLDNKNKKLKTDVILDESNLAQTKERAIQRLLTMFDQIKNGENIPAWGDDVTCEYCQFNGICRTRLD